MIRLSDPYLGYRHPDYALSLDSYGRPRSLAHSGGWVLERSISGSSAHDAMGTYPLFSCSDWNGMPDDLDDLRRAGLVSLIVVTDPLVSAEDRQVFECFDVARPFKTHYLFELERPLEQTAARHHRKYARKASRHLDIDIPSSPLDYLDEWCELHDALVARHGICDLRAWSREGFRRLLTLPGAVMLRALRDGRAVGGQVVLLEGAVAHAHLAAFSVDGYRYGASYLLDWHTVEFLRGKAAFVNWGGGRGLSDADTSGLAWYKRGWSTMTGTSFILGTVLDRKAYEGLCRGRAHPESEYFPAYRVGEFR